MNKLPPTPPVPPVKIKETPGWVTASIKDMQSSVVTYGEAVSGIQAMQIAASKADALGGGPIAVEEVQKAKVSEASDGPWVPIDSTYKFTNDMLVDDKPPASPPPKPEPKGRRIILD